MGTRKCCVGGCNATSETHQLFSFPKNDSLRNQWMSFLVPTNSSLLGLSKMQLLRKRVCVKHFDRHQFDNNGRRLRYSYPCLLTNAEIDHGVPLIGAAGWNITLDHNYFKEQDEEAVDKHSCIKETDDHNYCMEQVDTNIKTSGTVMLGNEVSETDRPSCSQCPTVASNIEHRDVMLEKPSCSGLDVERESERIQTAIPPTPNSSKRRKIGSKNKKFINQIKQMAQESLSHSTAERLNKALAVDIRLLEKFDLLNKQAKTFMLMQLKQVQKSKMARRFTLDEKLLALLLMKQSPKGYKLLEKMFALPNKRTLIRLSEKVSMEPGLNPKIFDHITRNCENWDTQRKLCTIVFDEVALTPRLTFDEKKEKIVGFVDLAEERKLRYCDHSLVFMLRGICSPWRQSVAYYFCEGTVSAAELQKILKQLVPQLLLTGLIPLGLVCDQGSTFRTAIRKLREDTIKSREVQGVHDDGSISISGHDMSVFHDPPHLLKGLRNNFMSKDIIYDGKRASWKDIEFVFDIDSKLGHTKALPKVTAHHVDPKKMKKMKVSVAAQVLSARMAAMLKFTNAVNQLHNSESQGTMVTTAEVVEFFDKLFDSVNGYPGGSKSGKLRRAVKVDSPHHLFWSDAIKKLKSLNFIDNCSKHALRSGNPRKVKVPSLQGWITTLESFRRISKILFNKYDVNFYYPRNINQDPLENFFGRIRALNARNNNPDPMTFIYAFKSLLITNLLSPHSKYANCEEDDGEAILKAKCLFQNENFENTALEKDESFPLLGDKVQLPSISRVGDFPSSSQQLLDQVRLEKIKVHCSAYTAGYVCRKMSKNLQCANCLQTYTTRNEKNIHLYIQFREYTNLKNKILVYPTENLLMLYRDVATLTHKYLNQNCFKNNIKSTLKKQILNMSSRYSWLGCANHKKQAVNSFINVILRLQVHNWCNIVNKILNGAIEEKYVIKMSEPQKLALMKYKTFRLRKKCLTK